MLMQPSPMISDVNSQQLSDFNPQSRALSFSACLGFGSTELSRQSSESIHVENFATRHCRTNLWAGTSAEMRAGLRY